MLGVATGVPRSMRAAVVAAFALLLAACGEIDEALGPAGRLVVRNRASSVETIERVDLYARGAIMAYSYEVSVAPGESTAIRLDPDDYDVKLHWSDGHEDNFSSVTVTEFDDGVVEGEH